MNFGVPIAGLIKEAKRGIRFKELSSGKKGLLIFGLVPLIISAFCSIASYYVLLFFYKGLASPLEYLHNVIKKEAKEVKHAAQFALYWLTFPFVFGLYVLQSFVAILFYFQWFTVMINVYLVTLGGVKFQPFIMETDYETEVNWKLSPSKLGTIIYTYVLFGLYLLSYVGVAVVVIENEVSLLSVSVLLITVMLTLVNPLLFKKKEIVVSDSEIPAKPQTVEVR